MPQHEFKATQGLLQDDMRKQAGRLEKAILEGLMNLVDANASSGYVTIEDPLVVIEDDGDGMNEEEIELYFSQFGFKDDDVEEKTFGKFRRGRGQIFNYGVNIWHTQDNLLVVNLDEDKTAVPIQTDHYTIDTDNLEDDDSVIEVKDKNVIVDTTDLSFSHLKTRGNRDGTRIEVYLYDELDDESQKSREVAQLSRYISWLHEVEIFVNGLSVEDVFDPDFEADTGFYQYDEGETFATPSVYNLGAYVNDIRIKDSEGNRVPVGGTIVTSEELDLNNARNEIIEGDSVWEKVKEEFIAGAKKHLLNVDDLSRKQKSWLLTQAANDPILAEDLRDKKILETIDGEKVSLSDLGDQPFSFAPEGNAVAMDIMDRKGTLMLTETFEQEIKNLPFIEDAKDYEDMIDEEMKFEMQERSEENLSKRRSTNLERVRWFLNQISCYDHVKPGFSRHENVWKDGDGDILIDEDFLNANRDTFVTEVLDRVVEVAAHDGDTRRELVKNRDYYRRYHRFMNKSSEARRTLIKGNFDPVEDRSFR